MTSRIDEIAPQTYRIATDVALPDGQAFSFNQYLLVADEPLLWHTGPRTMHASVRAAIARVLDPAKLRWIGYSHFETDECGALNQFLAEAPNAAPLTGQIGAMLAGEQADAPTRALAHNEVIDLGGARLKWLDAPHTPHGWDNGFAFEETRKLMFSGDLFTQPGGAHAPIVESDILGPSEAFRQQMDYYAHTPQTRAALGELAALNPETLACMHGSAWRGDGANLLRALGESLAR